MSKTENECSYEDIDKESEEYKCGYKDAAIHLSLAHTMVVLAFGVLMWLSG